MQSEGTLQCTVLPEVRSFIQMLSDSRYGMSGSSWLRYTKALSMNQKVSSSPYRIHL